MAEKPTISLGIEGMTRDLQSQFLNEKTFTFQNNGNLETDEYGGISLTNEHSNLLCRELNTLTMEYSVIGSKVEQDKVILFLVVNDKVSRRTYSEIGYIPYGHSDDLPSDVQDECGCNYENILAEPVEGKKQLEGCKYITIINDECNGCLNFSIKHPIKKSEIKGEKLSKRLYFTDGVNPPRYLELSNIDKYKSKKKGVETISSFEYSKPEKLIDEGYSCKSGWTYNTITKLCEKASENCSTKGLDIVFVMDATASQHGAINNIKNSFISTILPTIKSKFGDSYRTGLLSVLDQGGVGNPLYDIRVPFLNNNETSLVNSLKTLSVSGGRGADEPYDLALKAVVENLPSKDEKGNILNHTNLLGSFREESAKLVVMTADNKPSGFNDWYEGEVSDKSFRDQVIALNTKGIQLALMITPPTESTTILEYYKSIIGDLPNVEIFYNERGEGITDSVITKIDNLECENSVETEEPTITEKITLTCNRGKKEVDTSCREESEKGDDGVCYTCVTKIDKEVDCGCVSVKETDCFEETCIDCSKLKIFKDFSIPRIIPNSIQYGGNLKLGTYEYVIAYSDEIGNTQSDYYSLTNQVKLFEINKSIMQQTSYDRETNYGIIIDVKGLDIQFDFYKILSIERTDINGNLRVFELGVFPTSQNKVLHTTSIDKKEVDFIEITRRSPKFLTWGGLTASNGYLFGYDFTTEKEWNLQPVINFLGEFVQWSTTSAKEDLYADGVANSLYTGYMRDETYPLSIQFLTESGYKTANIPLIGRKATLYDLEEVKNTTSFKSVNKYSPNCSVVNRNKRWQFFNTSSVIGECQTYDEIQGVETIKEIIEHSTIEGIKEYPKGEISVDIDTDEFESLIEYIEDNKEELLQQCSEGKGNAVICEILTNKYLDVVKQPTIPYPIQNVVSSNMLDPKYCMIPKSTGNIDTYISKIDNEKIQLEKKVWPNGYEKTTIKETCDIYIPTPNEGLIGFSEQVDSVFGHQIRFLSRNASSDNDNLVSAEPLTELQEFSFPRGFEVKSYAKVNKDDFDFFSEYEATRSETGEAFKVKGRNYNLSIRTKLEKRINKGAQWYRVTKDDLDEIHKSTIVEITKEKNPYPDPSGNRTGTDRGAVEYNRTTKLRLSIFRGSKEKVAISSEIIDMKEGWWKLINETDFGNEKDIYIVLEPFLFYFIKGENPWSIYQHMIQEDYREGYTEYLGTWIPIGCFNIHFRQEEYSRAIISYDKITVNKKEEFSTFCKFLIPNINSCKPIADKYGKFAYTESTDTYPNNEELYNSKYIKIPRGLFNSEFEKNYSNGVDENGNLILTDDANFSCKNIRHFKFPDNNIAPFMSSDDLSGIGESIIHPIGIKIDDEIVNKFLDLAVSNLLITEDQRKSVIGYELFRGDRTLHKSILYKGIASDMYNYKERGDNEIWSFRNFPYNSLGDNNLLYADNNMNTFIKHPYNSRGNTKYSLLAPEIYNGIDVDSTEVTFEGYQLGYSEGQFKEVEGHAKWVIMGDRADKIASEFASMKVGFQLAMNVAENTIQALVATSGGSFFGFGSAVAGGAALAIVGSIAAINAIGNVKNVYAEEKMRWLDIFRNNGKVKNFASFYTSKGILNTFLSNTDLDNTRGISKGIYMKSGRYTGLDQKGRSRVNINNLRREGSYYFSLGEDSNMFKYSDKYINWDNSSVGDSSRFINSDVRCRDGVFKRRVGNPYMSLKNYSPSQYGTIDSINWITTSANRRFSDNNDCKTIFGGDVTISRVAFKTKFPFFLADAMKIDDRIPFDYFQYPNVGQPRFYVSYDSDATSLSKRVELPVQKSTYNLNCGLPDVKNEKSFYLNPEKTGSKFYLYYYGIESFLVESTINNNFRVGGNETHEQFFPLRQDYEKWTQEEETSIEYDNTFFYNNTYSLNTSQIGDKALPSSYSKKVYDELSYNENGVVWSLQDNSEVDLRDPWLFYRPLDQYNFETSYGKLIDLSGIESQQVFGRFENQAVVFNAVDTLADRITPNTKTLGTGGIFATRPLEFNRTDLGETGSQHYSSINTEFGVFWTDAKRGKVFQLPPGGKNLIDISGFKSDGSPSGMRNWFKRHLPFKILKDISNAEIDNHFNSLGILMWWDSKFKRVFITKRDYKVLDKNIVFESGEFKLNGEVIEVTNKSYFKDVSWTIAYSPIYQSWISYYDFHPDFAISYNDYFQTGHNNDKSKKGIWTHLITNKSYQVFYGELFEWTIELPTKVEYINKTLNHLNIWATSKRFQGEYDFVEHRKRALNNLILYNNTNNSGNLVLNYSDGIKNTPKLVDEVSQKIPTTHTNNKINVSYFYNRVINQDNNIPIWKWDENEIKKSLNPIAISFKGKKVLERLRGDVMFMRASQYESSLFKHTFKWNQNNESVVLI